MKKSRPTLAMEKVTASEQFVVEFVESCTCVTVVPALGESGHLLCADTLSMSRHISRLNYL